MAFLIVRVEPCENDCLREAEKLPVTVLFARRWPMNGALPIIGTVAEMLAAKGYEMGPIVGGLATKTEWPLTAYVYVSANRQGMGRVASSLHRWPVRKSPGS